MSGFYKSGYQYAAGLLLSREQTPTDLARIINEKNDSFYDGMRAALRDYVVMINEVKYGFA